MQTKSCDLQLRDISPQTLVLSTTATTSVTSHGLSRENGSKCKFKCCRSLTIDPLFGPIQ